MANNKYARIGLAIATGGASLFFLKDSPGGEHRKLSDEKKSRIYMDGRPETISGGAAATTPGLTPALDKSETNSFNALSAKKRGLM